MVEITIQNEQFCAAHFIIGHQKCSNLHGHNYIVDVSIIGDIDKQGFVIDFSVAKHLLRKVIDKFDHKILVPVSKEFCLPFLDTNVKKCVKKYTNNEYSVMILDNMVQIKFDGKKYLLPLTEIYFVPVEQTSVELLVEYITHQYHKALAEMYEQTNTIYLLSVSLHETANTVANNQIDLQEVKK